MNNTYDLIETLKSIENQNKKTSANRSANNSGLRSSAYKRKPTRESNGANESAEIYL